MSRVLDKLSWRGRIAADVCLNWEVTQVRIPEEVRRERMAVAWLTAVLLVCNASSTRAVDSVVDYSYDAAGNIVAIQSSSTGFNCSSFSPTSGPIGETVDIAGSGFSLLAANNTVNFNGVPAQVLTASHTHLTVVVPPSATTGAITVALGTSALGCPSNFTVTLDYGVPTIAGFSPTKGVVGAVVSIAGSEFNPTAANDAVQMGVASAAVATATSSRLTVQVPSGTGSGKIKVTTPKGTAVSGDYFFVPPPGHTASDVVSTGATTLGTSSTLSIGAAGKVAMLVFDVVAPTGLGISGSASTLSSGTMQLIDPTGTIVASTGIATSGATIPVQSLTKSGTYAVAVVANAGVTGSLTLVAGAPDLAISNVSAGTATANADGSFNIPVTYTVTNAGGTAAPPSWFDMAYLSVDGTLDANDQALSGPNYNRTPLAPGAAYTLTNTYVTSPTTSDGSYTLFVKADGRGGTYGGIIMDNGSIAESNEANNVHSLPVTLAH